MTWHNSHLVPAQRCIFVWIDEMMWTQCVIPENIYNSPTEGEIQIKLYTFLKIFWPWRTVHPPGNFNPFCGSSMFFFLELHNLLFMHDLLRIETKRNQYFNRCNFQILEPCVTPSDKRGTEVIEIQVYRPACAERPFSVGSGLLPHFRSIVMIILRTDWFSNVWI